MKTMTELSPETRLDALPLPRSDGHPPLFNSPPPSIDNPANHPDARFQLWLTLRETDSSITPSKELLVWVSEYSKQLQCCLRPVEISLSGADTEPSIAKTVSTQLQQSQTPPQQTTRRWTIWHPFRRRTPPPQPEVLQFLHQVADTAPPRYNWVNSLKIFNADIAPRPSPLPSNNGPSSTVFDAIHPDQSPSKESTLPPSMSVPLTSWNSLSRTFQQIPLPLSHTEPEQSPSSTIFVPQSDQVTPDDAPSDQEHPDQESPHSNNPRSFMFWMRDQTTGLTPRTIIVSNGRFFIVRRN